jgi:hypothetical protein
MHDLEQPPAPCHVDIKPTRQKESVMDNQGNGEKKFHITHDSLHSDPAIGEAYLDLARKRWSHTTARRDMDDARGRLCSLLESRLISAGLVQADTNWTLTLTQEEDEGVYIVIFPASKRRRGKRRSVMELELE